MESIVKDQTGQRFLKQLELYPCFGGLDLAAVNDLTAFVLVWSIKDYLYVHPWFFLPSEGLPARCKRDNVPYNEWYADGLIELTEGSTTDWRYVTSRIKQITKLLKVREVGFDSWGGRDVVRELIDAGIQCVDVSQSIQSLSAPSKRFQELVLSKKLIHTGHAVLKWNLDCCTIYTDPNNNIKVLKPPLGKSSKRIDGIIATIIAISRLQKAAPELQRSIYSTRGLLTL